MPSVAIASPRSASTPKHDFDKAFQARLVRVLFQFPDASRDVLDILDPGTFDTAPMRWVVRKLKALTRETGIPPSMLALEYEATKDVRLNLIKSAHIGAYAGFLARLSKKVPDKDYILNQAFAYARFVSARDFVLDVGEKLATRGQDIDWDDFFSKLDKQRSLASRPDEGDLGDDYFEDTDKRFERRKVVEKDGIQTGIPRVDSLLRRGGLPRKQLGVVMAPPGRGKTAALAFLAGSAMKQGKKVLYVSLELDKDMIGERIDARVSGLPMGDLDSRPKEAKRRIRRFMRRTGSELRIKYFSPGALSSYGLRSYLKRLQAQSFYPDVVLLDYADNMDLSEFGGGRGDSDYGPLGSLYIALRGIASDFNMALWTASQTTRLAVDKADIGIQDLADSFRKAAVADFIMAIAVGEAEARAREAEHKPKRHGQQVKTSAQAVTPPMRHSCRLCIVKNRTGPTGAVIPIKFDTSRVRITCKEL